MREGQAGFHHRSNAADFHHQADLLRTYFAEVVEALHGSAIRHHLGVRFAQPDENELLRLVGRLDPSFFLGEGERIFPQQIEAHAELAARLLDANFSHDHVSGLTQSGKNGLITCLIDFFGPVLLASRDRWLLPLVWLPNNKGMESQSEAKFRQAGLLNSVVRVETPGAYRTVAKYRADLRRKLEQALEAALRSDDVAPSDAQRLRKELNQVGSGGAFCLRRSRAKQRLLNLLLRVCVHADVLPALFMDESHLAIGADQGADRLLAADLASLRGDAVAIQTSFYEMLKGRNGLLISISATNTPFNLVLEDRPPVHLRPGRGYCGFAFLEGRPFPIDHDVVEPEVISVREMSGRMNEPGVALIDLRAFNNSQAFIERMAGRDWSHLCGWLAENFRIDGTATTAAGRNSIAGWLTTGFAAPRRREALEGCELAELFGMGEAEEYFTGPKDGERKESLSRLLDRHAGRASSAHCSFRATCQDTFARLWQHLLLDRNPQKKKGGLVRWELRNEGFDEFIRPLNERFRGRMKFIAYMDDHAAQSAAEVIRQQNPEGLPYVLVVTGMGRYGETYPPECGYAFDATDRNSTVASFTQSLLGRMTGYGKYAPDDPLGTRPLIILSDNAYANVFLPWYRTKGAPPKVRVHQQLDRLPAPIGRPVITCVLERNNADEKLQALFAQLFPFVANAVRANARRAPRAVNLDRDVYRVLEPYFPHIEANLATLNPLRYGRGARARILRRGEVDSGGFAYALFNQENEASNVRYQLGRYNCTRRGGGLLSGRNMDSRTGTRQVGKFRPVALDYDENGVQRVTLPFVAPVEYAQPDLLDTLRNKPMNVPDRVGTSDERAG